MAYMRWGGVDSQPGGAGKPWRLSIARQVKGRDNDDDDDDDKPIPFSQRDIGLPAAWGSPNSYKKGSILSKTCYPRAQATQDFLHAAHAATTLFHSPEAQELFKLLEQNNKSAIQRELGRLHDAALGLDILNRPYMHIRPGDILPASAVDVLNLYATLHALNRLFPDKKNNEVELICRIDDQARAAGLFKAASDIKRQTERDIRMR